MPMTADLPVIGELRAHAVSYAELGLEVFPVDPGTKQPMAAHHRGAPSQYAATTDVDTVETWWNTWPDALIGHRLPEDQIVLDIDPRHGGDATWRALTAELGFDTKGTRVHLSGRGDGGGHVTYQRPAGKLTISRLDAWARERGTGEHIDKADRHVCGLDLLHRTHRYTILPPSPHPETGQPYRWRQFSEPGEMPAALAELLIDTAPPPPPRATPKPYAGESIADWYTATRSWNDLLPRAGWTLRAGDGDSDGSQWRHPTATSPISATTRHGCLFVYCVDESTEALTTRGWLTVDEIRPGDLFLTVDPVDREIRWQPATLNVFAAERRDMVRMRHKQFDALVTPNHRWLLEGAGRRGGHPSVEKPAQHFRTTEEMIGWKGRMVTGGGNYDAGPAEHMDEFVELVGWAVTEGTYAKTGNGISVAQSFSHNPQHVERLQQLADHFRSFGATVSEYQRDTDHGDMRQFYFGAGIAAQVRAAAPAKAITPEFLLSLGNGQLELLYRTLMNADGHVGEHGTEKWTQQDLGRVDGFTMLCALLGVRTHARPSPGDCQTITAYKAEHTHTENIRWETEEYDGRVWCPTTPTGTWMARHNGFTFWTGNSPNTPFEVTAPGDVHGVTRFAAYTLLEHGGDASAAAKGARELKDGPAKAGESRPRQEGDPFGRDLPPAPGPVEHDDEDQADETGARPAVEIFWTDEVAADPPPPIDELVTNLVAVGEVTVFGAPRAMGKTWATMSLAGAVSAGEGTLFGSREFTVTRPATVAYLQGELGRSASHVRWNLATGGRPPHVAEIFERLRVKTTARRISQSVDGISWTDEESVALVDARLEPLLTDIGVELLVIDPWATYFAGNENSNDEVEAAIDAITQMARRVGCAVWIVHHISAKATHGNLAEPEDLWRGASRLADAVATRVTMLPHFTPMRARELGLDRFEARRFGDLHVLQRNGPPVPIVHTQLERFEWREWEPVNPEGGRPPALSDRDVVEALRDGPIESKRKLMDALEVGSHSTLDRHLDRLVQTGVVVIEDGPNRSNIYRLNNEGELPR